MRTCTKCGEIKEDYLFSVYTKRSGEKAFRNRCLECSNLHSKAWQRDNSHKSRGRHFKAKYGITLEEYDNMVLIQCGLCAICNGTDTRALAVDHDHRTGKVRGLLCQTCNTGIGLLKDDFRVLNRATEYVKEFLK